MILIKPNVSQYDLSITNTTCNPDGARSRVCLLINNRMPGPVITANWGDTIRVTIRNKMQHNGTSIHWHGLRQLNSVTQDGVNGITECALAPGDAKTYQFKATEYGTSWYHSHFSGQYGDGVIGPMVIHGPATANYDIDLGPYVLQDWYYITAYQAGARAFNGGLGGAPPTGDNILVNGTNKNAAGGGAYNRVSITAGKKYRLRIINSSIDAGFLVSLDGHPFQVIAHDFVPVVPYTTNYLKVAIGEPSFVMKLAAYTNIIQDSATMLSSLPTRPVETSGSELIPMGSARPPTTALVVLFGLMQAPPSRTLPLPLPPTHLPDA
jgi:FtsP/CotA-like multicopper oxidase with cupredoxin domain